jgi:beta-N-acetylhexosaminidase
VALAVAVAAAVGATAFTAAAATPLPPALTLLVGQTIIARMPGQTPSPGFLRRIELGQIGGVILFSDNYGQAGPKALISRLQQAARQAGRPSLLIAVDQEGGLVRRLPGAPSLAPPQMLDSVVAEAQGLATARNLAAYGVNVDLAPVCDVGRGGFITPRAFGATPVTAGRRCAAFARGLARGGVLAAAKHFPGLGYAKVTTDTATVRITTSVSKLKADLAPFTVAIAAGVQIVMVSTALYPALGARTPAATSPEIIASLLRGQLAYQGVVITDALDSPGVAPFYSTGQAAVAAINAGADLVLAAGATPTDADSASTSAYKAMLAAAKSGSLPTDTLAAAYQRIMALKTSLPR